MEIIVPKKQKSWQVFLESMLPLVVNGLNTKILYCIINLEIKYYDELYLHISRLVQIIIVFEENVEYIIFFQFLSLQHKIPKVERKYYKIQKGIRNIQSNPL